MKYPAPLSPKIWVLMLAMSAMLIGTGAKGGCGGGSLEPEISAPTNAASCPDTAPELWASCTLDEEVSCNYQEMICCDAEGNPGESHFSIFARCSDGQWFIAMPRIGCAYGYWPDHCYEPITID